MWIKIQLEILEFYGVTISPTLLVWPQKQLSSQKIIHVLIIRTDNLLLRGGQKIELHFLNKRYLDDCGNIRKIGNKTNSHCPLPFWVAAFSILPGSQIFLEIFTDHINYRLISLSFIFFNFIRKINFQILFTLCMCLYVCSKYHTMYVFW